MELTQKELEYWLASVQKIGPVKTRRLLEYFGNEEAIYHATRMELEQVEGITQLVSEEMLQRKNSEKISIEYKKMLEKNIQLISVNDTAYPEKLKYIEKAPYALFCRGELPKEERLTIAIVGARNCSAYGKEMALWFGKELSDAGIQVISGLAFGIDGYAHQGALHGGTPTYGVLGNGIDICYPKENFSIYMKIQEQGGILSEYSPGTRPATFQFPMRNRIISGLADMVIVIEARFRSGSLITADQALEQGRDVYAVPGRITDPLSRGCNELIRQGAGIITDPVEFVEKYFSKQDSCAPKCKKNKIALALSEEKVYSCLDFSPTHLSIIVDRTGFSMQETVSVLMQLMMKGLVTETSKNYYALKFR